MTKWITRAEMAAIPALELPASAALLASPRVSVLMMTRNHGGYLRQAVESVTHQVCDFPIEVIIGEDCSSDATRDVALHLQREHPERIRILTADHNVGITANFLRLVAHARGEYLAFLEGDDYWTRTDKLQRQVELLDRHPEYAWCGARTANRMQWLPPQPSYGLDDILRRYIVHTSTVVFRAALVAERYPAFPDRVCWESMLLAFLTEKGRCGFLDEEMSYYRRHPGGLWHNAERLARIDMSRDCIDALNEYFGGRYRRELAEREAWIYRMDTAPPLDSPLWRHWWQSLGILGSASARLARTAPPALLGLWGRWLIQPITAPFAIARRRLGLGGRLRGLRARLGAGFGKPVSSAPLNPIQSAAEEVLGRARNVFFVQIGSNDGQQGDPLRGLLLAHPGWRGVFVEPVGFLFEKLKRLYAGQSERFAFENVAIGTADGVSTFFHVSRAARSEAGVSVPHWCDQLGSFSKEVLLKNLGEELSTALSPFILATEVETLTLASLLQRNRVEKIDLLHIDAEGYDYRILRQLDLHTYRPAIIAFEHAHLADGEREEALALLNAHGYLVLEFGRDTLAVA